VNDEGGRRELTLLDCIGLGINGIIGSGIFLLPAAMARRAGGRAPLAWLAVGALCALVALCFAEASSRPGIGDRSGGPYRYASETWGPQIGFVVGWITLTSSLLGYAAVARGFAEPAVLLFSRRGDTFALDAFVIALVGFLALVNILGLKPSARTSDLTALIKLLALGGFVAVGVFSVRAPALHLAPTPNPGETVGMVPAAFAGLFACTGFEYVPVPAGEIRNPQRAVGLAMVLSVIGATMLYAVAQLIVNNMPDPGASATPLIDAARGFAGPAAATVMTVAATISAFGFCSTSALVGPRYIEEFARDKFLPPLLERRSARFGTPVAGVVLTSVVVIPLALTLDFVSLADTSNVAVVAQYVSTSLAVLVLRRRNPGGARFTIPFGPLVPILATLGTVAFLFSVSRSELVLSAWLIGIGLLIGVVTRWLRR
jgi:amino acid transporter